LIKRIYNAIWYAKKLRELSINPIMLSLVAGRYSVSGTSTRDDSFLSFFASSMEIELFENGTLKGKTVFLEDNERIVAPLEGVWGNGEVFYIETYKGKQYNYDGYYNGRSFNGRWILNSDQTDPGLGWRGTFDYNLYELHNRFFS